MEQRARSMEIRGAQRGLTKAELAVKLLSYIACDKFFALRRGHLFSNDLRHVARKE
jgi:hypothetical protein